MSDSANLTIRVWTHGRRKLPDDLPEALQFHTEHIAELLAQGCLAGNICDESFDGWWEIKRQ